MTLFTQKVLGLFFFAFLTVVLLSSPAMANPKYASIVVDANSNQVITEKYADKRLYPASLTKMMTLYLMFEALEQGKWTMNTRLYVSRQAEKQPPSKLGLTKGARITVKDAIMSLIVKSANDVAVVVAENHSGSEYRFAQAMTKKAKELGMKRTLFKNASGLPNKRQISTARDMAVLALALMRHYPQHYSMFSKSSFSYKGKRYYGHNRLMKSYPGMDGLKTGYIRASGFNLASSAVRNGRRLVGIVFGGRTSKSRNSHMATLLDRGFVIASQGTYLANNLLVGTPPVPSKKPEKATIIASLDTSLAPWTDEVTTGIRERVIGQGAADVRIVKVDPVTSVKPPIPPARKAIQPVSYSASNVKKPVTRKYPSRYNHVGNWSIQVGAFHSRVKSDYAMRNAQKRLPHILDTALKRTVPVKGQDGAWVFRARLTGLDKTEALQACKYLDDCLVVSPN